MTTKAAETAPQTLEVAELDLERLPLSEDSPSHENILYISNFISRRFHKVIRMYVYAELGGESFIYEPMPKWKTLIIRWLFFSIEFSWIPKVV